MGMNVGYYILCLILMIPLAAVTAFAALIESMAKIGFWTTLWRVFAPLLDPLGAGIWGIALILGLGAAVVMGFFPKGRRFGFLFLVATSAASFAFLLATSPEQFDGGLLLILSPSIAGLALSGHCAVRSFRGVGA